MQTVAQYEERSLMAGVIRDTNLLLNISEIGFHLNRSPQFSFNAEEPRGSLD